jgi:hypothetical protein
MAIVKQKFSSIPASQDLSAFRWLPASFGTAKWTKAGKDAVLRDMSLL